MVVLAVHGPDDRLGLPVAAGTVPFHAPGVPLLVWHSDSGAEAVGLVANSAGENIAVSGAKAGKLTVDHLEDVELAALGPGGARADRVAQDPEGGPVTLFVADRVVAEPNRSLRAGHDAAGGREDEDGLYAARRPGAIVEQGDDLQGAAAREPQVLRGGGIHLQLVVYTQVAGDNVPVRGTGRGTSRALEGVRPVQFKVIIPYRRATRDQVGGNGQKESLREHLEDYLPSDNLTDIYTRSSGASSGIEVYTSEKWYE